ncbi:MAG: hypothetical protein NTW10_10010 [Bacteroidetes bacterium]|nr:hypothetical protein [Bacteroidota bacterium]
MGKFILAIFLCMMVFLTIPGMAQEESQKVTKKETKKETKKKEKKEEKKEAPAISDTIDNILLEQQWSFGVHINTNGWGLKFRKGRNLAALKQFMWEMEFTTYKSAKEIRTVNPNYSDSKSYFYGKMNTVYFLRGGIGFQHILNRKPYWGGVQLSYLYYGGFSLGIAKPVYLFIITQSNATDFVITQQRYNPDLHFPENIYGRGAYLTGIQNIGLHPGIYAKGGLEFEFGTKSRAIQALEIGAILDYSPIAISIMAYNPKQSLFLTAYLSFSFGKRYNK